MASYALKAAKSALRSDIKRRVSLLGESEKMRQSDIVVRKLFDMKEFKESKRVSVFLSMPDEISTRQVLVEVFKQNKTCFIPRYYKKSNRMDMVLLESLEAYDNLPVTSWNIKQPSEDDADLETAIASGKGLDLILVPGLAFTKGGNRLGRGRGYYDTYLTHHESKLGRRPVTIALAFTQQICDHVPTGDTDVTIDHVIYSHS